MIRNVLEHIGGIERYGIVSILIFFACFAGVLVWVILLKKPYLLRMAAKPLEPDSPATSPEETRHE
jgi:hypothetical protein